MNQSFKCKVLKIVHLTPDVFTLTINRPNDMKDVFSSQFFHLKSHNIPYLRRPISISRVAKNQLDFTIIAKGEGTKKMQMLNIGESIDVLGPLGNSYKIDSAVKRVLIIGGGIGVPPQAVLAETIKNKTKALISVQLGFRDTPYLVERFTALTDDVTIASESGKGDYTGYVTDLTESALKKQRFDQIYVCGPKIVIKKVAKLALKNGVPAQLLMEERMACGVGACMVCACKVKDEVMPEGYWYKRVCVDGPVFNANEVIFDD